MSNEMKYVFFVFKHFNNVYARGIRTNEEVI